jgi:hypothetical protein
VVLKATLRRLRQLEHRCRSESFKATDESDARERILEKISAMADPRRGNPDLELMPMPTMAELRERIQKAASGYRGEEVG